MNINHEKLISLLAKEMEVEEDLAAKFLKNLTDKILENVKKSPVRMQGVGIFSFRNGALTFDPGISLATEVNYKYAGLAPVPVDETVEEAKTDEDVKEAQIVDEDVADEKDTEKPVKTEKKPTKKPTKSKPPVKEEKPASKKEEPAQKSAVVDTDDTIDDPFAEVIQEEPKKEPVKTSEPQKPRTAEKEAPKKVDGPVEPDDNPDDVFGIDEVDDKKKTPTEEKKAEIKQKPEETTTTTPQQKSEEQKEPEPEVKKVEPPPKKDSETTQKSDVKPEPEKKKEPEPVMKEVPKTENVKNQPAAKTTVSETKTPEKTAADKPKDQPAQIDTKQAVQPKKARKEPVNSSYLLVAAIALLLIISTSVVYLLDPGIFTGEQPDSITQVQPVNNPPPPIETEPVPAPERSPDNTTPPTPTYGLHGPEHTFTGRVYTIVVHSLPTIRSATNECTKIEALELRCIVREVALDDGTVTFRVGIGQFASVAQAKEAMPQLPEPYLSNNFIIRAN